MPAGYAYDEKIRAFWLAEDPTDPTAPTEGEVTDNGTTIIDLSGYLAIDGLATNHEDQRVDGGDLLTGMNAESMGRYGAKPSLTLKRRLVTDDQVAFDKFKTRQHGCLVVFPFIEKGEDPQDGDECYVYTSCTTGAWKPQNTAANTEQRGVVEVAIGGDIYLDGVVGGGS